MKIVDRLDLTPSGKFEGVQASPPQKNNSSGDWNPGWGVNPIDRLFRCSIARTPTDATT